MKNLAFLLTGFFIISASVEARELTYKFGAGYRQHYTNARVNDANVSTPTQVNGLEMSYGIAHDISLGGFFGFVENFDFAMMGPTIRYEFQRLINRDASIWNNLHLFAEAAFLAKFGGASKGGICIHAPYFGFEILPFNANNFAISTSAGLVIDFVSKNRIGFTQALLGDLGVKYYF